MKTMQTIALTLALALSLSACTATPKPKSLQLSLNGSSSVMKVADVADDAPVKPESLRHEIVSKLVDIVVACATSGYCW
jgi:starvation-inducible outer membrane lipoprotein